MFWHLRKDEDSPARIVDSYIKADKRGELDDMDPKDLAKFANQFQQWQLAQGRNLYYPTEKEKKFFLKYRPGLSEIPYIGAISGGNRAGKSCTCVIDVIMQIEGWHPLQRSNLEILAKDAIEEWVRDYAKELLAKKLWIKEGIIKGRCVAVDFPQVERAVGPEYEKWLTLEQVEHISYDNDKKRRIKWKNGSFVEFMTYEQPVKTHGGPARDIVQHDEEALEDIWQESNMRVVSTNGRMLLGMTAINGVTWTEDAIWAPGIEQNHKDIYAIEMSTYENPVNTQEVVDRIKAQCRDETEVAIRIYGKRVARGGKVYDVAKDEEPWVIERFQIPQNKGTLICSIDPHARTPHGVMWIWVDYDGPDEQYPDLKPLIDNKPNLYEVGELFEAGHIPHLAHMMTFVETRLGRTHDVCYADPSAWNTTQAEVESRSIVDSLNDEGIYPIKGSKDLSGGILKVYELLSVPDGHDHPRLMTFDDLMRTRWERKNYRWPTPNINQKDPKQLKDRPVDRDDHLMECERRICEVVYDDNVAIVDAKPDRATTFTMFGQEVDIIMPSLYGDNTIIG